MMITIVTNNKALHEKWRGEFYPSFFIRHIQGFYSSFIDAFPYLHYNVIRKGDEMMGKHIKTLNYKSLADTVKTGGCGECQTSCQSACKTSCTVGNQVCAKESK